MTPLTFNSLHNAYSGFKANPKKYFFNSSLPYNQECMRIIESAFKIFQTLKDKDKAISQFTYSWNLHRYFTTGIYGGHYEFKVVANLFYDEAKERKEEETQTIRQPATQKQAPSMAVKTKKAAKTTHQVAMKQKPMNNEKTSSQELEEERELKEFTKRWLGRKEALIKKLGEAYLAEKKAEEEKSLDFLSTTSLKPSSSSIETRAPQTQYDNPYLSLATRPPQESLDFSYPNPQSSNSGYGQGYQYGSSNSSAFQPKQYDNPYLSLAARPPQESFGVTYPTPQSSNSGYGQGYQNGPSDGSAYQPKQYDNPYLSLATRPPQESFSVTYPNPQSNNSGYGQGYQYGSSSGSAFNSIQQNNWQNRPTEYRSANPNNPFTNLDQSSTPQGSWQNPSAEYRSTNPNNPFSNYTPTTNQATEHGVPNRQQRRNPDQSSLELDLSKLRIWGDQEYYVERVPLQPETPPQQQPPMPQPATPEYTFNGGIGRSVAAL